MIYVIGPRDKVPEGAVRIDVTSKAKSIFSPFYSPTSFPVKAKRMENAWQFSKVFPEHDRNGKPSSEWYAWNKKGLQSSWAERYPMGKGVTAKYSWFNDQAIDYVEARKQLYIPLYRDMLNTPKHQAEIQFLISMMDEESGYDLALWDFDGYNDPDKTWDEIVNDPDRKMGHAFVLRQVILEQI